jgi:hypothetical protein
VTVLVSIPTYGVGRELLEKSVRSVLAQTHRDLVCVVVGDGETPDLPRIPDSRLIVHSYSQNRGAYFAQDVAIWASPHEHYAVVASDDWVDPNHIESMLALGKDVACGALYYHNDHYPDGIVIRKAYEVGLYRTSRYHEIGAHNPNERIGQDSLTLKVMRLVAPVGATSQPTYHRFGRQGSLSTHPDTCKGAPARVQMRERNRAIVARCQQLRRADRIKAYRQSLVPADVQAALDEQVELLRAKLA